MRIAIFSDVHGNLIALEKFISTTRSRVDSYICLGDVVDYGPWNDECLERIYDLPGIVYLQGNHERLFLGIDDIKEEIPLVQSFFYKSHSNFSRFELINALLESVDLFNFRFQHTINNQYIYPDTEIIIDRNYIVGHSHYQFSTSHGRFKVINPGSVGINKKCINKIDYIILDTEICNIEYYSIAYNFNLFISELYARHYDMDCINYFLKKPKGIQCKGSHNLSQDEMKVSF